MCMMYFTCHNSRNVLRVPDELLPMGEMELREDLTYQERPIKILETAERVTRSKTIRMCKVQWSHHSEDEATWEHEEDLKADYPDLFSDLPESRGRDSF